MDPYSPALPQAWNGPRTNAPYPEPAAADPWPAAGAPPLAPWKHAEPSRYNASTSTGPFGPGVPCPPHLALASPWADGHVAAAPVAQHAPPRAPPVYDSATPHAALSDQALSGEVMQKLLLSRLFTASAGLDTKHRRPFMVSFPVGPVSVGIGLDVCRLDACDVSLNCREDARQDEPCYLTYSGETQRGVLVGFGASGAGIGGSLYGGGQRGTQVAFRRTVADLSERRLLRQACWD